jgi:hypothetical protein
MKHHNEMISDLCSCECVIKVVPGQGLNTMSGDLDGTDAGLTFVGDKQILMNAVVHSADIGTMVLHSDIAFVWFVLSNMWFSNLFLSFR